MLLKEILIKNQNKNKVAIYHEDKSITYKELFLRSKKLSNELKLLTKQNISIFTSNSIEYAISYFSITMANKIIVPINPKCLERTFRILNIRFKFDYIVCADDTKNHKPSSEPMLELIRKCNCKKDEIIYIGDTINDSICAEKSGVDFGLALWGADSNIKAKYYFNNPYDLLSCSLRRYSFV